MRTLSTPTSHLSRRVSLSVWIAWIFIVALSAFGIAAANIPFSSEEVRFAHAMTTANWLNIFSRNGIAFWLLTAVSFSILYVWFEIKSPRVRTIFTAVILLLPVTLSAATFDLDKLQTWLFSFPAAPIVIYELLFGKLDGEFYAEGTLLFAALGWWSILWTVLLLWAFQHHAFQKSAISPDSFPLRKNL